MQSLLNIVYQVCNTECRLDDLKVSKYYRGADKFPLLKGRAAELRHLPHPLLGVFRLHMDRASDVDRKIELLLQMACQMEDIITDHRHLYAWPEDVSSAYLKAIRVFVQCNQSLGHEFHERGKFLFHMTMKYHYMLHIGLRARHLNPTLGWCFSGETMMKRVKGLCASSHKGSTPLRATQKVFEKYCFGLGLALHGSGSP